MYAGENLAKTDRGICGLDFVQNNDRRPVFASLEDRWQNATLIEDPDVTRPFVKRIFNPSEGQKSTPLHLVLSGTMVKIPMGAVVSYEDVAAHIGMPKASRAVGNAVGSNPEFLSLNINFSQSGVIIDIFTFQFF
jgi:AraC family transcriptional regulator of adaptative response/methylated-DNA-[protein]-cysteine methyltransferase